MDSAFREAEDKWLAPEEGDAFANLLEEISFIAEEISDLTNCIEDDDDIRNIQTKADLLSQTIADYQKEKIMYVARRLW